ncbi:MAG: MBL fold metallo-hydrolase [Phycisphaerae bacterium]|nr:MBL fold metallo-hydrolase [Phycisphaerae bacterium]
MISQVRITVLVENTARGRGLLAEHGLALWIEADGRKILFDTGQGMALAHNAQLLGVDLNAVDDVILSHGHYDHTGGLDSALEGSRKPNLYVHPAAFDARSVRREDGTGRSVGAPVRDVHELYRGAANVILTSSPTMVTDGVWVTGEIPRRTDFEDTGGPFYLDEACQEPDPLLDDQAAYLESPRGLVVLLGCCHAGLVNTLDYVAELTGQDLIHAVLGGMHLLRASDDRLSKSGEALERYGVRCIGPAHCTGQRAALFLWTQFPAQCVECTAGARFTFG